LATFPWLPIGILCLCVVAVLLAVAPRYGWHRDELYFLEAGHHLAWGYLDQPPFTPFVAHLADTVAPGNLVVLRLLPAITTAVTISLGAALVREFGGRRGAQIAGAAATAAGGFILGVGHLLSTAAFDLTAWMALLWVVARLLRTDDTRWWLAFGAIAGVSMLNKNLLVLLATALLCGLVVERRWTLLTSPWLLAGGGFALVIAAPNLVWQVHHGWPQIEMARVLSRRLAGENRVTLIPFQILFVGPGLIWILWRGARWLGANPQGAPFRALLWAWPAGILAAFITGGRPYYVIPLTTTVMLAGVVAAERTGRVRRLAGFIIPTAVIGMPISLPLLPISTVSIAAKANPAVAETVGWPELTRQVAGVVRSLPPNERNSVVLLAASYGEAGALDRFGRDFDLPHAFSGQNSYADFRQPTDDAATVVAVRYRTTALASYFVRCDQVGSVDNGRNIANEAQGTPILVCRGLRGTWTSIWPRLRFLA